MTSLAAQISRVSTIDPPKIDVPKIAPPVIDDSEKKTD